MNIRVFLLVLASAALATGNEWTSLFDGRSLAGWKIECRDADRAKNFWRARDGAIECDTTGDRNHDYVWLVSEQEFTDFEFECLVQSFATSTGNSGVQIRSRFATDTAGGGWMHGPQIDIHPPAPWRTGMIYDETAETKRWICPPMPDWNIAREQAASAWRWIHHDGKPLGTWPNQTAPAEPWNRLRITARGTTVTTEVNGLAVSRFDGTGILDDTAHRRHQVGLRGHLALQLHARDDLRIRFKDLRIRTLPSLTEKSPVTVVNDDSQLRAALATLRPGSIIRIAPGNYRPGLSLSNIHGTAETPIVIEGLDPRSPPLFQGGSQAWHLSDVSHLHLRWLHFKGQSHNGLNLDDGGSFDTPSHHVLLEHLRVEDTGPNGNFDAIKCSGVDHLRILRCQIAGWGGQAIDFVGCHHAEISWCRVSGKPGFSQHTGPQFKGGSSDVRIHDCHLENAGMRPVQAGGSTGLEFFRPLDAPFEAARIRIDHNTITGGQCAVAFTGVDDADFEHNTILHPEKWILRILQESRDTRFAPCRKVRFSNNTIVFRRARVQTEANIGPGTAPDTFRFAGNRWFADDSPGRSKPNLPTPETGGTYGVDPKLPPAASP